MEEKEYKIGFNWENVIKLGTFFVVVTAVIFGASHFLANTNSLTQEPKVDVNYIPMDEELEITDIVEGQGEPVKEGDTVSVHYAGTLENGKEFDSSYTRNQPFEFQVGMGSVIKGWDLGLVGMKVGGKRKLIIPSELGYGEQGAGDDIPPNSTLIFEIELLNIK